MTTTDTLLFMIEKEIGIEKRTKHRKEFMMEVNASIISKIEKIDYDKLIFVVSAFLKKDIHSTSQSFMISLYTNRYIPLSKVSYSEYMALQQWLVRDFFMMKIEQLYEHKIDITRLFRIKPLKKQI